MHDDLLASLPLFQNLGPETRAGLEALMVPRRLHRGEVLFSVGDEADAMFILVEGKVKLTMPSRQPQPALTTTKRGRPMIPPARESLLGLIGPGEFFGELSVLDEGHRATTATAMLECRLWCLPGTQVRELMARHHDFTIAMVHQLAHRIRLANEVTSGLVLSDVPGRLAYVLLSLADRFGTVSERGIELHHDLTQSELAQMVGASRETVNKVLTDFVVRRWITTSGRTVVIKDPARLRARVQ